AAMQATKDKNSSFATGRGNYRQIRQRFMKASGYTEALGELAGVVRSESSHPDPFSDTSAPVLRGHALPTGGVEIKSNKDNAEARDIYGGREGDATLTFLMRVTRFPWVDARPLLVANKPETRRYEGQFVRKGQPAGNRSATLTVVCTG